jgi:hypothetical protein
LRHARCFCPGGSPATRNSRQGNTKTGRQPQGGMKRARSELTTPYRFSSAKVSRGGLSNLPNSLSDDRLVRQVPHSRLCQTMNNGAMRACAKP